MTEVRQGPSGPIVTVGEGGAGSPLIRGKFVDPSTTVPTDEQTGAATAPFATVQAAISALPTPSGGSVFLASAQYPAESLVVTGKSVTLIGLVGPQTHPDSAGAVVDLTACDITTDSTLGIVNVQIGPVDALSETPASVSLDGSTVTTLACDGLIARYSTIEQLQAQGDVALVETTIASVCDIAGDLTALGQPGPLNSSVWLYSLPAGTTVLTGTAQVDGYAILGLTAETFQLRNCHIPATLAVTNDSFILQSDFEAGITITGAGGTVLSVDQATYANFLSLGGTLTDASLVRSDLPPTASTLNASGAAPIAQTVLPAPHPPGIYLWTCQVTNEAAATTGTLTLTLGYTDPDFGAATLARAALDLSDTGPYALAAFAFETNGQADVTVAGVFASITGGPPSVNVYNQVQQQGN